MTLDLFHALMLVANVAMLQPSVKEPMKFSNDCLYVEEELGQIVTGPRGTPRDKFDEGMERIRVLADSWFEDAIVSGCKSFAGTLMLDTDHCHRREKRGSSTKWWIPPGGSSTPRSRSGMMNARRL